ncbi:MAG: DUF2752 domain-containing protein [Ilumatobacteraceae bacterium]
MEVGLSASVHRDFARRVAPVACGAALAVTAGFVATHDPGAAGSRFPGCAFHQMTGLWCPGCGLTRGTYQMLHGHIGSALSYNVFTPVVLAAIVAAWVVWLRASRGAPAIRLPQNIGRWSAALAPVVLIAYAVLRNIPAPGFRSLAP